MRSYALLLPSALIACLFVPPATAQRPNTPAKSPNSAAPRRIDYPAEGVLLGNGWDSLVNQKTSSVCVTYTESNDSGQEKWEDVHSISDQFSLMNELQVSAEAEVKAMGATVSAKTKFVETTKINNEFSNFSVRAVVQNGVRFLSPEKETGVIGLTPLALKLANTDPIRFEQVCGDTFVSSLYGGAELDAVLIFSTRSQEDHSELEATMNFSGWNVEATASATTVANKLRKNNQMHISYYQNGGSGESLSTDQEGLNKIIQDLPTSAAKNPKPYQIGVTRYDTLPDWPQKRTGWNTVAYQDIASQYLKLNSLRIQVADISAHQADYIMGDGVTEASLNKVNDALLVATRVLKYKALNCLESDGANCGLQPNEKVSDYQFRSQLPVAKASFPEATTLAAAENELTAAELEVVKLTDLAKSGNLFDRVAAQTALPAAQQKVASAEIKRQQAVAMYLPALKKAIARTWLLTVNSARCRRDVLDSGCLSQSDLDFFIGQIKVNPHQNPTPTGPTR